MDEVHVSVRNLVEFILRSGDIVSGKGPGPDPEAMQLGSRMHRKLQKQMGADYQAEVPLELAFSREDLEIAVEGRADGIFCMEKEQFVRGADKAGEEPWKTDQSTAQLRRLLKDPETFMEGGSGRLVVIDEIKGIFRMPDTLESPEHLHLAQAMCYAFFLTRRQEYLPEQEIGVQITYVQLETEETLRFRCLFTARRLEEWFLPIVEEYRKWALFRRDWRRVRTASIHETSFPFPFREGQKQLAADVYRTIARGKTVFVQAPTGTGKTLAVLFPSVKAVGEGLGETIFYLTARTIARTAAQEAFDQLRRAGLRYKTVTLTAKEKICCMETPQCDPQFCPRAKGHFDRINEAVFTLLGERDAFARETVEEAAERFCVCPFELALDLSVWTDAVIGDYNYVFHPRARLRRYFGENVRGDYLFLVDEAHNLVDRGRDMYSASLVREDFEALRKIVRSRAPALSRALSGCSRSLLALRPEGEAADERSAVIRDLGKLQDKLTRAYGLMEEYLREDADPDGREAALELYFQIGAFLDVCDRMDEHYITYADTSGGRLVIWNYCMDPSARLQECLDRARSCALFSATLLPVGYYKRMLSTRQDNYAVSASSCFDPQNLQILIGADVCVRYRYRSQEQYRRIAEYLRSMVLAKAGNYLVFFSSYQMLGEVTGAFQEICPQDCEILCQSSRMSEQAREEFLNRFSEDGAGSLMGMCVMGSFFGEGIDLRGERLIGVAIVGAGLPQVGLRQNLLREYYDGNLLPAGEEAGVPRQKDGFFFSYLCPGMNRVLQAAGRVIRTEKDRGVVLLLDERFTRADYRAMFPAQWVRTEVCRLSTAEEKLRRFWEEGSGGGSFQKNPYVIS